jgi:hypothetical protein
VTTPRYPTSAKYRRHRSKSYLVPAIFGVLFGVGVFLVVQLFSGDDAEVKNSKDKVKSVNVEITEDVMPISDDDPSESKMVSLNIPVKHKSRSEPKTEIKKPRFIPAKKPEKTVKRVEIKPEPKKVEIQQRTFSKQAEKIEPKVDVIAPLPSGLRPKTRGPDVEITFYREFSKRKVVVPKEEVFIPEEDVSGLIEMSKTNKPRPKPQVQKVGLLGVYQVHLVIIANLDKATSVVRELRKKRAPSYLVKVKGAKGDFYRIRLGPFSSQSEAKWAMDRWKIKGSSPLILRQRP